MGRAISWKTLLAMLLVTSATACSGGGDGGDIDRTSPPSPSASAALDAGPPDAAPTPHCLKTTAFDLPGDGAPNDNAFIGPFCCTGRTVTIRRFDGVPVGYAYVWGFAGGFQVENKTFVTHASVMIAGAPHLWQTTPPLPSGTVDFGPSDVAVGATKTATVGSLQMTFTVEHAATGVVNGQPMVDMGSLELRMDVQVVGEDDPGMCPIE